MNITIGELASIAMVLLSMLGTILIYVTKIAKIENTVASFADVNRELQDLITKVTLLWDIYIADALKRQRTAGNIISASPDVINPVWTEQHKIAIDPAIHERLQYAIMELRAQGVMPLTDADLAIWVAGYLGLDFISKQADILDDTIQGYIARQLVSVKTWVREQDVIDGGGKLTINRPSD